MDISLLRGIGLTENEIKVYLSLLKQGRMKTAQILHLTDISSGKVYETLDKLHKRGLVTLSRIDGVKQFQATNPKSLLSYVKEQQKELEEKEREIKSFLPSLLALHPKEEVSVNYLVGKRSIEPLIREELKKANTIYAMGIRGTKNSKYNNFWLHLLTELVDKKGKKALHLFSENTSEYYKKFQSFTYIEAKYVDSISPAAIDIIGNQVFIFSYGEEMTCVHIKSEQIAKSFSSFFLSLWNQAKN